MKVVKVLVMIFVGLLLLAAVFLQPLERTSPSENGLLDAAYDSVSAAQIYSSKDTTEIEISFGRVNITPSAPMPMAGYRRRPGFESVHDSLYFHFLILKKGEMKINIVSADLLIFPGEIMQRLQDLSGPENHFYFSASHTHNGLGGWQDGIGGQLIAGSYQEQWVDETVRNVSRELEVAGRNTLPAALEYFAADAHEYVKNRLVEGAPVDGKIRGLKFKTEKDSLVILTYSGHPTLLPSRSLSLSNDYPGSLTRLLEKQGYSFAMFLAGMVGSHRITNVEGAGFERIDLVAELLADRMNHSRRTILSATAPLSYTRINIPFGSSQARIGKNIALRNWVYSAVLEPLEGHISVITLGDLTMVSTPCDFSGELYSMLEGDIRESPTIITSFNGDYVGYITKDEHYDESTNDEVRIMNWVGPNFGSYFVNIITAAVEKIRS